MFMEQKKTTGTHKETKKKVSKVKQIVGTVIPMWPRVWSRDT